VREEGRIHEHESPCPLHQRPGGAVRDGGFRRGFAEARLKEFSKDPTLVFQTDKEIIIIPATAIESITIALPADSVKTSTLPNLRKAKRLR
jgi:hypothetical protein